MVEMEEPTLLPELDTTAEPSCILVLHKSVGYVINPSLAPANAPARKLEYPVDLEVEVRGRVRGRGRGAR